MKHGDFHPNGHDRLHINSVGMQSWHQHWCNIFGPGGKCDCRPPDKLLPRRPRPMSGAPSQKHEDLELA
jgi:hypothetical protein